MVPLEAMACGRPVLAYRGGGAVEVVQEGITGDFFERQEAESLVAALRRFRPEAYDPGAIRTHAEQYDRTRFRAAISAHLEAVMAVSRRGAEKGAAPT